MFVGPPSDAFGQASADLRIGQVGNGVAEIGGCATVATAEDLALLNKPTTIINEGDAPRAGDLGDGPSE